MPISPTTTSFEASRGRNDTPIKKLTLKIYLKGLSQGNFEPDIIILLYQFNESYDWL